MDLPPLLPPVPDLDESRWHELIAAAADSQPWEASGDLVPDPDEPPTPTEDDVEDLTGDELAEELPGSEDRFEDDLAWSAPAGADDAVETDDPAQRDDLADLDDLAGTDGFEGLDGS